LTGGGLFSTISKEKILKQHLWARSFEQEENFGQILFKSIFLF